MEFLLMSFIIVVAVAIPLLVIFLAYKGAKVVLHRHRETEQIQKIAGTATA